MSCTSDPQHSVQKCFHNHKWHYKVIHASLGRKMRGAEIKFFFFLSTDSSTTATVRTDHEEKIQLLQKCVWLQGLLRFGRCTLGCIFTARMHWGHSSQHPKKDLLLMTCLGSTSTSTGTFSGQGRPRQTSKMKRTQNLLEVPVGLPQPQRKPQ